MRLLPRRWPRIFPRGNAPSASRRPYRPALEALEDRCLMSAGFTEVNLASDVPGLAPVTDPHLVNPWGLTFSPTGPFWLAENGSGVSDLLDGRGQVVPLVVSVPSPGGAGGTPTGTVFNGGPGFLISEDGASRPARFLFATEDGTIAAWAGALDLTHAVLAVDNSASGAVYKGLALATDPAGQSFLYAADFSLGRIDVFDQDFRPVTLPGAFRDPSLPQGFAPFNIQAIGNLLYVAYAQQDATGHDDAPGAGRGFIDVYDTAGNLVRRFASQGPLDSPWGLALAPAGFGPFGGDLLVGNNGDGRINAYDPASGAFLGQLADGTGKPITISDLWGLAFGNDHAGGASATLFFTAGVDYEAHGLFGAIQSPQRRGADTAGAGTFDPHAPGEPGDYPLPPLGGPAFQNGASDRPTATSVLLPLAESSLALAPTLSPLPQPRVASPAPALSTFPQPMVPSATLAVAALQTPVPGQAAPAASWISPSAAVVLDAGPAFHLLSPDDSQTLGGGRTTSLGLNAFLDLNASQDLHGQQGGEQQPLTKLAFVGAEGQEAQKAEAHAEAPLMAARADRVSVRLPEDGPPGPAGEGATDSEDRGSWATLVKSLLVAVSIPLAWGYLVRPWAAPAPQGQPRRPGAGAPNSPIR